MASPTAASRPHHGHAPLDNEDVVMARALAFGDWARKNARVLSIAAGVVVLGAAAALYYNIQQGNAAARAATAYMEVLPQLPQDNPTAAARQLETFIATYDGTLEADEARMTLAQTHLEAGNAAKAVEVARQVADGGGALEWQGAMLLAAAQVAAKQNDAAIATYLAAADDASLQLQKEEALGQAGLLRERAGDFKGAAELFQRLVDMTEEGSTERAVYEMRLGEVKAAAAAAGK
jgi:predicted negative regulator of RcsB-dependent stress response